MPQVVEPDGRQSGVSGQPYEQVAHVVGPEHLAVLSSEDETSVDPRLTPVGTFLVPTVSVVTKGLDRARVEWDHPDAASSLRRAEAEAVGRVDQLLDDAQVTVVEIHINPAQAKGFPTPQATECDHMEQGVEAVIGDLVEEVTELTWRPYRGVRLIGGGQLDVHRWVPRDQSAFHGSTKGSANRRPVGPYPISNEYAHGPWHRCGLVDDSLAGIPPTTLGP